MEQPRIIILVCGLCVQQNVPLKERFRTSNSERGKEQMRLHAGTSHNVEVR